MDRANICIVVPPGELHALGLLDAARYVAAQLTRIGVETSLAKNRLRTDSVNLVFGAHLGFDRTWAEEFRCVLVNLEQLGRDARVSRTYTEALHATPVVDYHPDNVPTYRDAGEAVPLLEFGYADYLHPGSGLVPIEERPIDLLFFGSLNARRRELIDRIERCGVQVAIPDAPVYGPERDSLLRQSKAVLNIAHYSMARFEQVRAFLVLSQGTALVSERYELRSPGNRAFQDCVHWFDTKRLKEFFASTFTAPDFPDRSRAMLSRFTSHEALESVRAIWDYARTATSSTDESASALDPPHRRVSPPARINAAMPTMGYRPGWLNVHPAAYLVPDWQLDLAGGIQLPVEVQTTRWGKIRLGAGSITQIDLGSRTPNSPGLADTLDTCLNLLADDGIVVLGWPAGAGLEALDPYTRQFWLSGWLYHRFTVRHSGPLDAHGAPCRQPDATQLRVVLAKTACTLADRTLARAASENLGLVGTG